MNPAVTLRPAALPDMAVVARLAARLVRYHHSLDPQRFLLEEPIEPGYEAWLTRELSNPGAVIVVAERRGGEAPPSIVGYGYGRVEPRDWNLLLDTHGALHDLFVDDSARGQGVGAALVGAVASRLRDLGARRLVLHTAGQNIAAQRLFERHGFRRTMVEMMREI